jgi:hypothetical protein
MDRQGRDAARRHYHLFTVCLWKEDVVDGPEYRGTVRDVVSGAFHSFRHWSGLVDFMIDRVDENEDTRMAGKEGAQL